MHAKKGFTYLECLVCIFVLSTMMLIVLPFYQPASFKADTFVLELLHLQSTAMEKRNTQSSIIQNVLSTYHLTGNPSNCNTYTFDDRQIIVHLGWGRISVR